MTRRPSSLPLAIGLVVSLAAHVAVLLPLLVRAVTRPPAVGMMAGRFSPDDFFPAPAPAVELGIDADTPASTTWVGYETYREHLARLAEFEQAAFTDASSAAARVGAPPTTPEETVVDPTPPAPTPEATARPEDAEAPDAPETAAPPPPPAPGPDEPAAVSAPAGGAAPVAVAERVLFRRWLAQIERTLREEAARRAAASDAPPATTPAVAAAAPTPPGTTPGVADDPGTGTDGEDEPGEPANRESDATSTMQVTRDQLQLGQPLARAGLELLPRRPRFTTLTMLTAAPCNPLVRITFDADGIPTADGTTVVETSCDQRVDHAIETSLFRWRAKGKRIEALGEGETVEVELRIMLR